MIYARTSHIRIAPVIAAVLIALAGLKAAGLWVSFSSAAAKSAPDAMAEAVKVQPEAAAAVVPVSSPTEARLLDQLGARETELDKREAELDTRAKILQAAERRVDASIKALKEEKAQLALADDARKHERRDEIGALSSAYERMKPVDAARIFNELDDDILIPIAAGMRTQSIAGVLANMSPEKARALTIALASREDLAPAQKPEDNGPPNSSGETPAP